MEKLLKKIQIKKVMTLMSGLHIGGSKENVQIGGVDNNIVRISTMDNQPYVPGSSIKGKMRCLLEQTEGASQIGASPAVNRLFGITENKSLGTTDMPSRLIVRDAYLTKESVVALKLADLPMPYSEIKSENSIKRVEGKAENPRFTERIPAGVSFNVEFIINVWDTDNEDSLVELFERGLRLIENDYIGGSGSRGYGQVKFYDLENKVLSAETNWM